MLKVKLSVLLVISLIITNCCLVFADDYYYPTGQRIAIVGHSLAVGLANTMNITKGDKIGHAPETLFAKNGASITDQKVQSFIESSNKYDLCLLLIGDNDYTPKPYTNETEFNYIDFINRVNIFKEKLVDFISKIDNNCEVVYIPHTIYYKNDNLNKRTAFANMITEDYVLSKFADRQKPVYIVEPPEGLTFADDLHFDSHSNKELFDFILESIDKQSEVIATQSVIASNSETLKGELDNNGEM